MHAIDGASATPEQKFTEGSPVGGVPATVVSAAWLNDVQGELLSFLAAAGIAPVKGTQDQVLAAIRALFPSFQDQVGVVGSSAFFRVPVIVSGVKRTLIIQVGSVTPSDVNGKITFTFPLTYPNAQLLTIGNYAAGLDIRQPIVVNKALSSNSQSSFYLSNLAGGAVAGGGVSVLSIGY